MERIRRPLVAMVGLAVTVLMAMSGGCGSKNNNDFGGAGGDNSSGSDAQAQDDASSGPVMSFGGNGQGSSSGFAGAGNCPPGSDLSCFVDMKCPGAKHTTITGKVYDPAGRNPLYNIAVFVPNNPQALPTITTGTNTCEACSTPIEDYVALTQTANDGSFTLTDVPSGKNVPLVVQDGKWRRMITIPDVPDCGTVKLPDSGSGQARLPRNRKEGDMPQMALLTGGLDDLGCFMTRIGIDPAEYSAPQGGGRLDIYQGLGTGGGLTGPAAAPGLSNGKAGDCTTTSCPLWASKQSFENYDIVLLACEGDTFDADARMDGGINFGGGRANVTTAGKQAMHDWLNEGGKVFATHFHYTWFEFGPPDFQNVATWLGPSIGSQMINGSIDTSFVKGQAFHNWLQGVGALNANGLLAMTGVAASVSAVNAATTSRWIYDNGNSDTKYMSFQTPIGGVPADGGTFFCGKAVFTDLHAGGAPQGDVPGSCKNTALSQQEKALEFLFFDLAACVTVDMVMPPK
jgi:hypothetical protein